MEERILIQSFTQKLGREWKNQTDNEEKWLTFDNNFAGERIILTTNLWVWESIDECRRRRRRKNGHFPQTLGIFNFNFILLPLFINFLFKSKYSLRPGSFGHIRLDTIFY